MVIGALALSSATWRSASAYIACLMLVSGGLLYETGRPRPIWTQIVRPTHDPVLVADVLDEPHAIYVWLLLDDTPPPIAYRLPWNEKTAAQLVKAQQQAAKAHTGVEMKMPRGTGPQMAGTRMFYPQPQQPLPAKAER
jgi:hypothetical protein